MVGTTPNYPTVKEIVEKKLEEIKKLKATKAPEQIKTELSELIKLATEQVYTIYTGGVYYNILESYIGAVLFTKFPNEDDSLYLLYAQYSGDSHIFLNKLLNNGVLVTPDSFKEAATPEEFCELLAELCELEWPGLAENFKKEYPKLIENAKRRMIAEFAVSKVAQAMEDLRNTVEKMKSEKPREEVNEYYKTRLSEILENTRQFIQEAINTLGCNCTIEDVFNAPRGSFATLKREIEFGTRVLSKMIGE